MRVSRRLVRFFTAATVVLVACTLLLPLASFYLYRLSLSLPDFRTAGAVYGLSRTSVVYAQDGSVLAEWHGEQDRTIVRIEEIPHTLRNAVVAAEDQRFYDHDGIDLGAVLPSVRAASEDARPGGRTITQQLVRMLLPDEDRSLVRRLEEMLLAGQIEAESDKNGVLEFYLNAAYFGHGAYGVESAARRYFGHEASELDLAQSALLAGLIRAPGRYSPIAHPEAALERRDDILRSMLDLGFAGEAEVRKALENPIELASPDDASGRAPYFVEWVKRELIEHLGSEVVHAGGLRVRTTLDPVAQDSAEQAVKDLLDAEDDPETALVTVEMETGRVLAMIGGRDFGNDQFNLATQGRRQPGSAFKTFVLVRALEERVSPDEVFDATPFSVEVEDGVWTVQNYENDATSPRVSLRAATRWSVNAVYARLIMRVGPDDVVDVARRMGITSPLEPNPAIALGGLSQGVTPLEMASAYGTIGNGGAYVPPRGVDMVLDDRGERIWVPDSAAQRAIPESVALTTAEMLHDVVESGTGTEARIGPWAAGKTGTTQSYRDAWFVGWSGDLSTAVWVGHREGQVEMTDVRGIQVSGGTFPARIWGAHMKRASAAPATGH